jgi:deoxyribose-phosphate aldolase
LQNKKRDITIKAYKSKWNQIKLMGDKKMSVSVEQLANMVDHTNLKAFADEGMFQKLCDEAKTYNFKMVAINPAQTERCKKMLNGTPVHVGAAIGFPLGQTTLECKIFETKDAIQKGADEIDYVINIAELKNKNYAYIKTEMQEIVKICRENHVISKMIFENCYLTEEEKMFLAKIALEIKPDFIKTSTGFGTGGATAEDVKLMKSIVGDAVKVKAAGGIRDLKTALEMVAAGAERLGTSAGVEIIEAYQKENNK